MKKILWLFITIPFLLFFSIDASACPNCELENSFTYHFTYADTYYGGHQSFTFQYLPDSVSAPVYEIYSLVDGVPTIIILSDSEFSTKVYSNNSSDINLSGSGGQDNDYVSRRYICFQLVFAYTNSPFVDWEYTAYSRGKPVNEVSLNSVTKDDILAIDTTDMIPLINADGSVNVPAPFDPASDAHDFTQDVYDPDLAVPVLSNVSYTGFSIDNPEGKELQVVVDGRVYGLKWNPSYTDPMLLTNFNYTVNHQVWNFADHPDKISLNGRFDIYDNFGVSTYDWFVAQVKQYANDVHPSDYPNYSFLKVGLKTGWNTFLDYIKNLGSDEADDPNGAGHRFEQNIYRSRMCQVTYYVRFVEYDSAGDPHYSRWMAYTLKPSQDVLVEGENFSRGNVEFGEVTDVDSVTGRPVVAEKENLKYNTDSGEYEYYDPLSNQGFQFEMNDVFVYLSGLKDSVMGFADLIAYCFSFLPSWVSQFISYSLVVAISFSVIRLIRG